MKRCLEHVLLVALALTAVSACAKDDKTPVADTLDSIDTVKPMESPVTDTVADSSRIQNPSTRAPDRPRGELPPPGGETYRRGSSTMAPRDPPPVNDPPPNLIGEQRRQGSSTMSPTRQRDSTVGPRMEIDPQGRVTPIKK